MKAIVAALVVSLWSFAARADGAIHVGTWKLSGPQCIEGPNPTPKTIEGAAGSPDGDGGSITVTTGRKRGTWKICGECGLDVEKEGARVVRVTSARCLGIAARVRGGNLTFGGRPWRHSEIAPHWGIDVQDARGNSLVRLSPDGDVFAEGKLVENDPQHRALNAFASWMQAATHARPEGAFQILQPGTGRPLDDRTLDGEITFTGATGAAILKLGPRSGWVATIDGEERSVCGRALYGAFLLWLDGAEPGQGFRAMADRMIRGTSSSDCLTITSGAGGVQ